MTNDSRPRGALALFEDVCPLLKTSVPYRFTNHSVRKIAKIARVTADEVDRAIRRVRALRLKERAWWRSIWNAEWSLRWSLAAAPWRE